MITRATLGDALELASLMRDDDIREVWAATRMTAPEVCRHSLYASVEAWAVRVRGALLCVYGVVRMDGLWQIWLLSTTHVERFKVTFYRGCKRMLPALLERYGVLENRIHSRYVRSCRWAERLGGSLGTSEPYGACGEGFRSVRFGGSG